MATLPSYRVLIAVFLAGIVSLLIEMSLLREFIYVIGSTAFTNSVVISIFLGGLTAGACWGAAGGRMTHDKARHRFCRAQAGILAFLLAFYLSKDYFVYFCPSQVWVVTYFALSALVPSFFAGISYAAAVEILYERGQREVTHIYVWSTLGSVIGGLAHGFVFVYFLGLQAAYVFASFCAVGAVLLVYPFKKISNLAKVSSLMVVMVLPLLMQNDVLAQPFYRFENRTFFKNSPAGVVEVWKIDPQGTVKLLVHNVHQYYSFPWDNQAHEQWAKATLEIVDRPSSALLLGYGSGISTATYLRSQQVIRVDTVENAKPVIEAGKIFFPEEYALSADDERSHIIVDDFRKYIRFTDQRYDIILLDHNVADPYFSGFFTLEFFTQLKKILKPGGVIAIYGIGMSWDTTLASFPYIYRCVDNNISPIILQNGYFLSLTPFSESLAGKYQQVTSLPGQTPIFSDHSVQGMWLSGALTMLGQHMKSMFKPRRNFWVTGKREPQHAA